jgi:Protein of unknown function (DUF3500)
MDSQAFSDEVARRTVSLLDGLPDPALSVARQPYDAESVRGISFRPHHRLGARLGDMPRASRRCLYQLLELVLSDHTFAQVGMIMGGETWISWSSRWQKDQQPDDYFFVVFGDPRNSDPWVWRFEGHHVSITAAIADGQVILSPVFLGASPATYVHRDAVIFSPLAAETELARAAIMAMDPHDRALTQVSLQAPQEIRFGSAPRVAKLEAVGLPASRLTAAPQQLLDDLVETYISRSTQVIAEQQRQRIKVVPRHFAWFGGLQPGQECHYLLQIGDLMLIEYGNNSHGESSANHVHTIIRQPLNEFNGVNPGTSP